MRSTHESDGWHVRDFILVHCTWASRTLTRSNSQMFVVQDMIVAHGVQGLDGIEFAFTWAMILVQTSWILWMFVSSFITGTVLNGGLPSYPWDPWISARWIWLSFGQNSVNWKKKSVVSTDRIIGNSVRHHNNPCDYRFRYLNNLTLHYH